MSPYLPNVTPTRHTPSQCMMQWVQAVADRAYAQERGGNTGLESEAVEVCCARGPVPPHVDNDGPVAGRRVVGLVLRSDGHVLHSDRLRAAGVVAGLPLRAGSLYQLDPSDRHWTECPGPASELIFSVHIMVPDRRKPVKLAHDMWWSLLAASTGRSQYA